MSKVKFVHYETMTYEEQKATGLLPLRDCIINGTCPPGDILGYDPFIKRIECEEVDKENINDFKSIIKKLKKIIKTVKHDDEEIKIEVKK